VLCRNTSGLRRAGWRANESDQEQLMTIAESKALAGRLARGAAFVSAAATAAIAFSVAPVQAEESADAAIQAGSCASGRFCMWEDANYSGSKYANWAPTGVNQKYQLDGWDGDNEISSLINNTRYDIRVYDNDDYSGESRCVKPGEQWDDLKFWYEFNDDIESAKTVSSC
jgi:hypothetical protein